MFEKCFCFVLFCFSLTKQVIDSADDLLHLFAVDLAVLVYVVHVEGHLQLVLDVALRRH